LGIPIVPILDPELKHRSTFQTFLPIALRTPAFSPA
jgi:hypothetical protein